MTMIESNRRGFFRAPRPSGAHGVVETIKERIRGWWANQAAGEAPGDQSVCPLLLPPGALPDVRFRETCTRCDACIRACPWKAIRRAGEHLGPHAGLPVMSPAEIPCRLCADWPCIRACERRALLPPIRRPVRIGLAVIDEGLCVLRQGRPCSRCFTRCPMGDAAVRLDERGFPRIFSRGCTGCGLCVSCCPTGAIEIGPISCRGSAPTG